jgi:endoribonuclease Dicer
MVVLVHGIVIAGPILSSSMSISKFAVAERALVVLQDAESEKHVERLCTCRFAMQVDDPPESDATPSDIEDDAEVSVLLSHSETEMDSDWSPSPSARSLSSWEADDRLC